MELSSFFGSPACVPGATFDRGKEKNEMNKSPQISAVTELTTTAAQLEISEETELSGTK